MQRISVSSIIVCLTLPREILAAWRTKPKLLAPTPVARAPLHREVPTCVTVRRPLADSGSENTPGDLRLVKSLSYHRFTAACGGNVGLQPRRPGRARETDCGGGYSTFMGGRQRDRTSSLCKVVFWLVLLSMSVMPVAPAGAADDIIFLKNGDRITGTIRALESDQIEIATSYAGTIKIGVGTIQRVQPARPLSVTVHEDVVVPEDVGERDGEHRIVNELSADGPLRLEDVKAFGIKTLYQRGNINLGGNHTSGNSSANALNVSATYLFRERWHRVQMSGTFNRGEANGQLGAENALATIAYDYLFSRRFFLSGQLLEEHDRFQDLTFRNTTTVDLGYYFFDRTKHALSVGVGPAMVYEKFRPTPSTVTPAASWFVRWYQELPGGLVTLYHNHQGYQDVMNHMATRIVAQQGIRVHVYDPISMYFEYNVRFNSNPVPGRKTVDSSLIFGVSYAFER